MGKGEILLVRMLAHGSDSTVVWSRLYLGRHVQRDIVAGVTAGALAA